MAKKRVSARTSRRKASGQTAGPRNGRALRSSRPSKRKRKGTGRSERRPLGRGAGLFPALRRADGCGAYLAVFQRVAGADDAVYGRVELRHSASNNAHKDQSKARRTVERAVQVEPGAGAIRTFAALGNRHRMRLLAMLLVRPAAHRDLEHATGLRAGPLYYHVNQLRLAGLVVASERNAYELTQSGRRAVLTAAVLAKALGDGQDGKADRNGTSVK